MRILIDARSAAFAEPTGVGTYTRSLLRELPGVDPGAHYVAWYVRGRDLFRTPRRGGLPQLPGIRERWTPFPSRLFEMSSERWSVPRIEWLARFDVLFAPNFVPPPTGTRRLVVTVHDLAFRRFPETAPHGTRRWLARLDGALRRAARIVVPSRCTMQDLAELYGVDTDIVVVVPHGVDHQRFNLAARDRALEVGRRYGLDRPYLLALGGIEPRKNLPALLQAYASLPEDVRPALVVAGGGVEWNPEGPSALRAALDAMPASAREGVVLTGYVPDGDVAPLVAGAIALAYPSRYEGFGLPVLEAMACGTPVLSSSVSAIPEVAGEAALLVDPTDVEAIADGLRRIVEDEELRGRLGSAGSQRAAGFTWETSARRTAAVLHQAG